MTHGHSRIMRNGMTNTDRTRGSLPMFLRLKQELRDHLKITSKPTLPQMLFITFATLYQRSLSFCSSYMNIYDHVI